MNHLLKLERIGQPNSCWVAEITGFTGGGGLERKFVKGNSDYSESNSKGTRGVHVFYILRPFRVYDVCSPRNWRRTDRYFVYIHEDGSAEEKTMKEVIEWLSGHWVSTSWKPRESASA